MDLREQLEAIQSREDFIAFMKALSLDAREYRRQWAHEPPAESFFSVIAARLPGMPDALPTYDYVGPTLGEQPTWREVAEIFFRARELMRRPQLEHECPNCGHRGLLDTDFWRLANWAFCKPCVQEFLAKGWASPEWYAGWTNYGQPAFRLTEQGTAALPGLEAVGVCNASGSPIYRCQIEAGIARTNTCPSCLGFEAEMLKLNPLKPTQRPASQPRAPRVAKGERIAWPSRLTRRSRSSATRA